MNHAGSGRDKVEALRAGSIACSPRQSDTGAGAKGQGGMHRPTIRMQASIELENEQWQLSTTISISGTCWGA